MNEGDFFGIQIQPNELNCTQEQLSNCFFNPKWENSMDQSDPFESALSSMVSSPAASNAGNSGTAAVSGDNIVLRELIGRLGGICNSGEVSPPQSYSNYISGHNSTNNSCYSTPLNSPPKLNLSTVDHQIRGNFSIPGNQFPFLPNSAPFSSDPGFIERAARYSCFGSKNLVGLNESEFIHRLAPIIESDKLSRVSSNISMKFSGSSMVGLQEKKDGLLQEGSSVSEKKFSRFSRSSTPENGEFGDSREGSSLSEQIPSGEIGKKGQSDGNARKRKSIPKGKGKETQSSSPANNSKVTGESEESNGKRSKSNERNGKEKDGRENTEENGNSGEEGNQKHTKENSKPPEPPKDYIHVRARRGQATDSHSLAERVRREKISERMKFLQDLVPGCNKITGKAVMLDEIINYVQSLQRQVEFLSMKLATVNPSMDNMEALLSKNIFQSSGSMPHGIFPIENSAPALPYGYQSQHSGISSGTETPFSMNPLNSSLRRNPSTQLPPIDKYCEAPSQVSTFWEDDLQSVIHMGFGQNQTQSFPGTMATTHMKIEP